MKKIFLLTFLLFFCYSIFSQTNTDIVYSLSGDKKYENVHIEKVQNNIVYFNFNNQEMRVEASAIKRNGQYIQLKTPVSINQTGQEKQIHTNGYEYYYNEYRRAKKRRNGGIGFFFGGIGIEAAGIVLYLNGDDFATLLMIEGEIFVNIGIPLWISGGVKAANNRRAMELHNSYGFNLQLQTTNNGFGFVLNF